MGDRNQDGGTRVYVGGLDEKIKKEDIEGEFEKFGKLNSVWVAFNPPGFAFVEFTELADAETACDNLNGTDFLGSKLRVEIARGRSRSRGAPRGRGGFRGGRDFGGPPRDRYNNFGGGGRDRGFGGSRDYGRSDSFGRENGRGGGGFRGGPRGGGRRFEDRFRSRSPNNGSGRHY
ncbi:unnamed protein product [Acanthoscelides obtectus]|uniref:RRM domain-containing protein n=1 Tax=Acanthoscelides obtectus TaxID=200917 RepID=A0A9P0PNC6_ACAOB|nr:unnamed protein product [Acanthoscelides obtectus]CAK1673265.1 RNA-binding protein Rsf1 [Acanthoscelides obtectus]